MLSIIPSTVKGVSTALVTPKQPSFFRIKSVAGGGGARRALAALGNNNTQLNMNMAKTHLAMAQEGFANRWNFNPVKEVPLALGRYQWAPLSSGSDKMITSIPSEVVAKDPLLLKDITNPVLTTSNSPPAVGSESDNLHKTNQVDHESNFKVPASANNQENSENEVDLECKPKQQVLSSSCETHSDTKKHVLPGSQMCLTDYFRPQKRKLCEKYEDFKPNTLPKKKLRIVH